MCRPSYLVNCFTWKVKNVWTIVSLVDSTLLLSIFFSLIFLCLFVTSQFASIDVYTNIHQKLVWDVHIYHPPFFTEAYISQRYLFTENVIIYQTSWCCSSTNANAQYILYVYTIHCIVCLVEQEFICLCINFPLGKYAQNQKSKPVRTVVIHYTHTFCIDIWMCMCTLYNLVESLVEVANLCCEN